jgi:hypothetical protein
LVAVGRPRYAAATGSDHRHYSHHHCHHAHDPNDADHTHHTHHTNYANHTGPHAYGPRSNPCCSLHGAHPSSLHAARNHSDNHRACRASPRPAPGSAARRA